ncbi:MAG: hypothetical protein SPK10_07760 [Treponema sp.]|nr:hypothetical protein [Treponema sp.]
MNGKIPRLDFLLKEASVKYHKLLFVQGANGKIPRGDFKTVLWYLTAMFFIFRRKGLQKVVFKRLCVLKNDIIQKRFLELP